MKILLYCDPWLEGALDVACWIDFFFLPFTVILAHKVELGEIEMQIIYGIDQLYRIEGNQHLKFNDKIKQCVIDYGDLIKIFANSCEANKAWYQNTYSRLQMKQMCHLVRNCIGDFRPDIIVTFISPVPFLSKLFPEALILSTEAGFSSRYPYHLTRYIDPVGVMYKSYLARYAYNAMSKIDTTNAEFFMQELHEQISKKIESANPFIKCIQDIKEKKQFEHYLLLPLQFSNYFAFDVCTHFKTQFDFLIYVLENIDSGVGVFVTEYGLGSHNCLTPAIIQFCRRRYNNFLYCDEFSEYQATSIYLYNHVDAVITVSSSVGLQISLQWNKIMCVLGKSHLNIIADCFTIDDLNNILCKKYNPNKNNMNVSVKTKMFYYLMTHYYIPEKYFTNQDWLFNFLQRSLRLRNRIDCNFYSRIDSDAELLKVLLSNIDCDLPLRK